MATGNRDQRRDPRITIRTTVWIGEQGIFTQSLALLRDVSVGGAFIDASSTFGVGAILSLRFRLPEDGYEVTCAAIVRHTGGGRGLGVEFLDLAPEAKQHLEVYVRQCVGT